MSVVVHHVTDVADNVPDDAPTVVMSNALGTTHAMWSRQVPVLSRRYRVVRYDTRGHGHSPVPQGPYRIDDLVDDLVALLDRLNIRRTRLVGSSLGGMTVLRLAARHPERVEALAVLCTSARLAPAESWLERAATVRANGTTTVADAVVARWYTEEFRATHPDVVARAVRMISTTPDEGYAGCCEAIAAMDLTADLDHITAPTLAVAGADDPATPPLHLEQIAKKVNYGRYVSIPSAAHLANDEQPDVASALLLEHLTTAAKH